MASNAGGPSNEAEANYYDNQKDLVCDISRRKTLLLPALLDLFGLLAYICGDFLCIKFEDDLWPTLMQILRVMSADALDGISSSRTQRLIVPALHQNSSRYK